MFDHWATKQIHHVSESARNIKGGRRRFIMATNMTTVRNAYVTKPSKQEVLITRVFDAPRELVFKAWTDPEHLMRWYAPRGCTTHFLKLDFHQGGTFHSCIRIPEGHECWCKGVYREIVVPEMIVFNVE